MRNGYKVYDSDTHTGPLTATLNKSHRFLGSRSACCLLLENAVGIFYTRTFDGIPGMLMKNLMLTY